MLISALHAIQTDLPDFTMKARIQRTEERPNPSQSSHTMAINEDNGPEEAEIQFYFGMVLKLWSIGKPLLPDQIYLVHRNQLKFIMQSTRMFGGLSLDLKLSSTSLPAISATSQGTTGLAHKHKYSCNIFILHFQL